MTRRPIVTVLFAVVAAVVAVTGSACGSDDVDPKASAPVPKHLVPASLLGGAVALHQTTSEEALRILEKPGGRALVTSSMLWELRRGQELVGALQIGVLEDKVRLEERSHRNAIVKGIIPASVVETQVGDLTVLSSQSADKKSVYLWFRPDLHLYQVLQLKSGKIDHAAVLNELVAFQVGAAAPPPTTTPPAPA